jgi:hypothetical protein
MAANNPADLGPFVAALQEATRTLNESMRTVEALVALLIDKGVLTEEEWRARIEQTEGADASLLNSLKQKPS